MKDRMCSSACLTAYGKSLCYQTLSFLMEHKLGGNRAVPVVSSLVALMEDQVYGDSCGLGTHGQLEWCNGEEGEVEEDL